MYQLSRKNANLKTQLAQQKVNNRQSIQLTNPGFIYETPSSEDKQNQQKNLTSLFQTQLYNHNIRKQIQKFHQRTINNFFKRKKQIVKFMNVEENRKKKIAEENYRISQCGRYINTQIGLTSNDGSKSECRAFGNGKRIINNMNKQAYIKSNGLFQNSYVAKNGLVSNNYSTHISPNSLQQMSTSMVGNNINKRQIFLSNITNINELKKSLSHSKPRFHRTVIKMERQIGKHYIPYEDKLPGGDNGIRGIFM